MADFMQAGKWVAEGKQAKRSTWTHNSRIGQMTDAKSLVALFWNDGKRKCEEEFVLSLSDFFADDWEIAE